MTDSNYEEGSLLGKDAQFNGKLTFLGTMRIEGCFIGEVEASETLVVAEKGHVKGEIRVNRLIVTGGMVEATVFSKNSVEILSGGKIVGDVYTPVFEIEKGAVFSGTSHMEPLESTSTE